MSGLASNAFGSFKSFGVPEENWLRDYLPKTQPNIGVLHYGYDSKLIENDGKESIANLATRLLALMNKYRRS